MSVESTIDRLIVPVYYRCMDVPRTALDRAIEHIETVGYLFNRGQVDGAVIALKTAITAMETAVRVYPDDRALKACGRMLRTLQVAPPSKPWAGTMRDIAVIVRTRQGELEPVVKE